MCVYVYACVYACVSVCESAVFADVESSLPPETCDSTLDERVRFRAELTSTPRGSVRITRRTHDAGREQNAVRTQHKIEHTQHVSCLHNTGTADIRVECEKGGRA